MNEPRTTQAGDWWSARQRGERLPEHQLAHRCEACGRSTPRPPICTGCAETIVEQEVTQ